MHYLFIHSRVFNLLKTILKYIFRDFKYTAQMQKLVVEWTMRWVLMKPLVALFLCFCSYRRSQNKAVQLLQRHPKDVERELDQYETAICSYFNVTLNQDEFQVCIKFKDKHCADVRSEFVQILESFNLVIEFPGSGKVTEDSQVV